tara:strand:- start:728 stop:829 length:102 start_codon:yes stop_codon:yes gene_type:complete
MGLFDCLFGKKEINQQKNKTEDVVIKETTVKTI